MICQDCKQEPAIYSDGATYYRCAECQYKNTYQNQTSESPQIDRSTIDGGIPHQTTQGLVSIILPVYMNNYALFHYTGNCIGSLREHTQPESYELIVIDNGSPIKPPSLQSYYAKKIIQNETNLGVTHAWNQGIRASFGEYIVLLNNDIQVYNEWLEVMKQALDHVDLVMATPMYSNTEPFARAVESEKILEKYAGKDPGDVFSGFRDFSCVMFKKSLIDEIGLFDEDFFAYCSDSDFLKRMEEKNKKFASCKMVATHHVSDATGASIEETPDIMNKDKATYAAKWDKIPKTPDEGNNITMTVAEMKYSIIDSGDGPRCAWCDEPNPSEEHLRFHEELKLVRTAETGDRIFYIKEDKVYPISSPETLKALGFDFGQERTISKEEFAKYVKGPLLTMENYKQYA